jgi:hypothetical protein
MSDKGRYIAEAHLTTDRDKEVVLRFLNLTHAEARSFMKIFDKFDHVFSNVQLNTHMWEKRA